MRFTSAGQAPLTLACCALCLALTSCVFETPVFKDGWRQIDESLAGVWATTSDDGKTDTAVFVSDGPERAIINYPAGEKGWYFAARAIACRDRRLMQLEILAQPDGKRPERQDDVFTLIWLEPQPDGAMQVRALDGNAIAKAKIAPDALGKILAAPSFDWDSVFGSPTVFRKK